MKDVMDLIAGLTVDETAFLEGNLDVFEDPDLARFDVEQDADKAADGLKGTEYASARRHGPRSVAVGRSLHDKGVFEFFEVEDDAPAGQVVFAFTRLGAEVMVSLASAARGA